MAWWWWDVRILVSAPCPQLNYHSVLIHVGFANMGNLLCEANGLASLHCLQLSAPTSFLHGTVHCSDHFTPRPLPCGVKCCWCSGLGMRLFCQIYYCIVYYLVSYFDQFKLAVVTSLTVYA